MKCSLFFLSTHENVVVEGTDTQSLNLNTTHDKDAHDGRYASFPGRRLSGSLCDAYISGFLDGDGSIFCSILERSDYKAHYQIKFCISFHQKTSRFHFLMKIQHDLKYGVLRNRNDGISELNIVGWQSVKNVLERLIPFLRIKKKQAHLVLKIIDNLPSAKDSPKNFIQLCRWIDQITALNDSKTQQGSCRITAKSVEEKYRSLGWIDD